jgi:hypothetical protein
VEEGDVAKEASGSRPGERRPGVVLLSAALYLLTTTVLLAIAGLYVYATVDDALNPGQVRPGDISFGDGSGLLVAAVFLIPALPIGAVGVALLRRWRRGTTPADVGAAIGASAGLVAFGCVAALMLGVMFG